MEEGLKFGLLAVEFIMLVSQIILFPLDRLRIELLLDEFNHRLPFCTFPTDEDDKIAV